MYFLPKYKRGILNRYRKGMPVMEMLVKDIFFAFQRLRYRGFSAPKYAGVLAWPHLPSRGSTIYKLACELRIPVTNLPTRPFDLVVYYEYNTLRSAFPALEDIAGGKRIVNVHSRDISKVKVEQWMLRVFGYGMEVDPLQHEGKAVVKSDTNALHNGRVIDCPVAETQEGVVYQRVIDNTYGEDLVLDLRVPIVGGEIPFVYRKYRKLSERFLNTAVRSTLVENLWEAFSTEELDRIQEFARLAGLEFGELDILRDNGNGHIYIVDVNNTPQGPPAGISKAQGQRAIGLLTQSFERQFLKDAQG